jgi:hypothetical protein
MFSLSDDDFFAAFRLVYVAVGLLAAAALWRKPRAGAALALVVGANLAACAVYLAPLGRLYALNEMADVSFNVGSAACAAATGNIFDHTQVGFAHLEPFWSGLFALFAPGHPERVLPLYGWLSPLSILVVGLGLYYGLAGDDDEADRWERVLIVLAVFGLASWSQTQRPPIPALWTGNFLLKPNHAVSWGLAGLALGLCARGTRPWRAGIVLGVMAWVFILDWAFLVAGLVLGTWLRRAPMRRDGVFLAKALGLSILITAPYVRHLMRDHNPAGAGGTPQQIWLDVLGQLLRPPEWATIDLGLLLILGLLGAFVCWRRRTSRDAMLLGLFGATWAAWLGYQIGARFGVTPEADEHHYFLRIAIALTAGVALAALARHIEPLGALRAGQGAVLVLALTWPLTFPAYWNPPSMDRYFRYNLDPIPRRVQQYTRWIREHTSPHAVFLTGRQSGTWIPILAGRRILLAADARPPADYEARKEAERTLLLSHDPQLITETARRYGITYIAIDEPMTEEYGAEALKGIGRVPAYEVVYTDRLVRIVAIRASGAATSEAAAAQNSASR